MSWLSGWLFRRKVAGAVQDAEEGKKGPMAKSAIEGFKASPGWRSAVMLLLLVVEGLARQFGWEAGPLFMILHAGFGAIGVRPEEANALGVDPAALIVGFTSLWFAGRRLWTVWRERQALRAAAVPTEG